MEVEAQCLDVVVASGCQSFDQFLRSNSLCEPYRYDQFKRGVSRSSAAKACRYGVAWTMTLGRMDTPTPEMMTEYQNQAETFEQTCHVAPSEQTVREWSAKIVGLPVSNVGSRRLSELQRLRAENAQLRKDLAAARAKIAQLESMAGGRATKKAKV
jgi:hypothetical protein